MFCRAARLIQLRLLPFNKMNYACLGLDPNRTSYGAADGITKALSEEEQSIRANKRSEKIRGQGWTEFEQMELLSCISATRKFWTKAFGWQFDENGDFDRERTLDNLPFTGFTAKGGNAA